MAGESVGGGPNPAVPAATRRIPMLFGGFTPATMERMARWGEGYIGLGLAAPLVEPSFEAARAAWTLAGREGLPRLVTILYFALGDSDQGRANIRHYYAGWTRRPRPWPRARSAVRRKRSRRSSTPSLPSAWTRSSSTQRPDDVDEVNRLAEIVL